MMLSRWLLMAATGLALSVTGCGGTKEHAVTMPGPRPVKLAVADARIPERIYSASGRIKAAQRAELSFDRADVLAELPVIQGQQVKEGEVLARLDTRNLEIAAKARQAAYDEALVTRDRLQRLFDRQAIARADLDRATAAFESAEANLRQVNKDLESSTLRAPFAGRVASIPTDAFQLVQPRQTIVVLHDLTHYEIEVQVSETFILQAGQNAKVTATARFDLLPDRPIPVKLKDFTTEADPETLTYRAVFTLDAPGDAALLPGMSASLDLVLQPDAVADACWVPEQALFSTDATTTLAWRVDPATGRVEKRHLRTGTRRNGYAEIIEGLAPGDTVVVSGLHTLLEGDTVKAYEPANRS